MTEERILVTGAEGFIGSHLIKKLLSEDGNNCYAFYKDARRLDNLKKTDATGRLKLYRIDLCNYGLVKKAVNKIKPTIIYHLAAVIERGDKQEKVFRSIKNNVLATLNLLYCLNRFKYKVLINVSTCEVYGNGKIPFKEDNPLMPVSPYSLSKAAVDMFCHNLFVSQFNAPIITVRFSLVYGPGQKIQMLIPQIINAVIENKRLAVTKGQQTRDFIYIDDAVSALIMAMQKRKKAIGQIINVGSNKEYSVRAIAEQILELMNSRTNLSFGELPYRKNEIWRYRCDCSKAGRLLGWRPKVDLKEGLKKSISWYVRNV